MPETNPVVGDVLEYTTKVEYLGQPVFNVHHVRVDTVLGAGQDYDTLLAALDAALLGTGVAGGSPFPDLLDANATWRGSDLQIVDPAAWDPNAPDPPGPKPPRGLIHSSTVNQVGLVAGNGLPGQDAFFIDERSILPGPVVLKGGQFIGAVPESFQTEGTIVLAGQTAYDAYLPLFTTPLVVGGDPGATLVFVIYSEKRRLTPPATFTPPEYAPPIDIADVNPDVKRQKRRQLGSPVGGLD